MGEYSALETSNLKKFKIPLFSLITKSLFV